MPGQPLSEAVQQMISGAVQMETIRRREEVCRYHDALPVCVC